MVKFVPFSGECRVPKNEHYLVFKHPDHDIYFSCCERGEALNCHFSSEKGSLRHIKPAINDWCEFVFNSTSYDKIIALTQKASIDRLISKCGFCFVGAYNDINVFERGKE